MITVKASQLIEFLQSLDPEQDVKLLGVVLALNPEAKSLESEELTEDGRPKEIGIQVTDTINIKDLIGRAK